MGKRRKFLVAAGILFAGLIVLVLLAPIWAPWLLRPVLGKYNVTLNSYERLGYDRLRLEQVSYTSSNLTFMAERMELHQPTVWLWRHFAEQFTSEDILVQDWNLTVAQTDRSLSKKQTSIPEIFDTVDRSIERSSSWIGTANLKSGLVTFDGQQLSLPEARWNRGTFTAQLIATNRSRSAILSAQLSESPKRINLLIPSLDADANFQIESRGGRSTELHGSLVWQTNSALASATFTDASLFPSVASIASEQFRIPAHLLRLEGYKDLEGSLFARWETNTFAVDLKANASPLDETNLPPVSANIHATGNTNQIKVEHATLAAPWLQAKLSTNVIFSFSGKLLSSEAAINVAVDLSKQSVIAATGRFTGEAFLQRSNNKYPHARFRLQSEGFAGYDVRLKAVDVSGELDWPWLNLDSAHIVFADGAVAYATGRYQLINRALAPSSIKLNGQIGHEFLPPDLSYTNIALSAVFSGPLAAPDHSGNIVVSGVLHKKLGPLQIASAWEGRLGDFKKLSVEAKIRDTLVAVAGAGRATTNRVELHLEKGSIQKRGQNILALQHPTDLRFEQNGEWKFKVDELALKGVAELILTADVEWPWKGAIKAFGTNVNSTLLEDYLGPEAPLINLNHLALQADWSNGPIRFAVESNARLTYEQTNSVLLQLHADSDTTGVDLQRLEILADAGPVLSGKGHLPLRIVPGNPTNILQLSRTDAISFVAKTVPNTQVWDEIARMTQIKLQDPNLTLNISGSLQDPLGHVIFEASSASWASKGKVRIPPLTDVRADLKLSDSRVQLTRFAGLIEGQPISLQAELPIGDNIEQSWRKFFDWRNASGRLWIARAQFAPFVKYFPDVLVPQGTMDAEIAFSPGPQFSGHLTIQDAATRPLPGSGPLQDVYARLRFVRRAIEFEDVHALLGGQPVNFLGRIDFATNAPGNLPLIDLYLRGENIPLARRTDLILRSDLNLQLSNLSNAVPVVSGNVRLRDSFYLGDLRQLIPGRVASPKRRPPYFSFEEPPFSDWLLNVQVTGENFVRARSPLFRGSMSANLRLTGPLKEPVALGDVRIESGTVVFPFANFRVTQGYVTLTSDNPYRPEILMNGTSRAFGYDLAMTLTGPADRPIIEFTSTPPLTSEQIILMVTAGEVPRRGFGFNTEQRAQRLALFVGKNLLSRFSDNAGAERLSITTGEDISEQGRETYALEYRINDNWSIVGEYDRFGALNVGMKWRIYSR